MSLSDEVFEIAKDMLTNDPEMWVESAIRMSITHLVRDGRFLGDLLTEDQIAQVEQRLRDIFRKVD